MYPATVGLNVCDDCFVFVSFAVISFPNCQLISSTPVGVVSDPISIVCLYTWQCFPQRQANRRCLATVHSPCV